MQNLRSRLAAVSLMVVGAVLMAVPAFATTPPAYETAANDAINDGVNSATSIVTTNIPLILGVVVAFVALKYGRKLLGKL